MKASRSKWCRRMGRRSDIIKRKNFHLSTILNYPLACEFIFNVMQIFSFYVGSFEHWLCNYCGLKIHCVKWKIIQLWASQGAGNGKKRELTWCFYIGIVKLIKGCVCAAAIIDISSQIIVKKMSFLIEIKLFIQIWFAEISNYIWVRLKEWSRQVFNFHNCLVFAVTHRYRSIKH